MKICRFDDARIGVVEGDAVIDVSAILDDIGTFRYPLPAGDALIARLDTLRPRLAELAAQGARKPARTVRFLSPVANPTKIIGAPANYRLHIEEAGRDKEISAGRKRMTIAEAGLFLKASSSLVGTSEGVDVRFPDRRTDHEMELAVVIGRRGSDVAEADALSYVAGYTMGLDMVVRGAEDRSLRKSVDSYSVVGPWLVTRDEIADPDALDIRLSVNGSVRQDSNTRNMIYGVARQIAWASSFYTLHPGDIIMTGTPEGVGPVKPGDTMTIECQGVGRAEVPVRAWQPALVS